MSAYSIWNIHFINKKTIFKKMNNRCYFLQASYLYIQISDRFVTEELITN